MSDNAPNEGEEVRVNRVTADKVPLRFRMQIEAQKKQAKLKEGGDPKTVEWEMFEASKLKMNDDVVAARHLDNYLDMCRGSAGFENICYDLFQDFWHGRKKIKSNVFAEKALARFSNTRDVEKLLGITEYFEENNLPTKAEGFYITLFDLFSKGEGVKRDPKRAADCMKSAIKVHNMPERREALRDLYAQQSLNLEEEDRMRKAYENLINDGIQFAKSDYALWLRSRDKRMEAVHWFVAEGEFAQAYETINIRLKKELDAAIEEFRQGGADTEFAQSLNEMRSKFETLQNIFTTTEEPLSFLKMATCYTLFGPIYAMYRTVKFDVRIFVVALLGTVAVTFIGTMIPNPNVSFAIVFGLAAMLIWFFAIFVADILNRQKFIGACRLWVKLAPHPKLEERAAIFSRSQDILNASSKSATLIIPVLVSILGAAATGYAANAGMHGELPYQVEERKKLEEQQRLEEQKRLEEQRKLEAEQKRLEEQQKREEQKKLEEQKRLEEQRKREEEKAEKERQAAAAKQDSGQAGEFKQSIGGLKIGQTLAQVQAALGKENNRKSGLVPGTTNYEYSDLTVMVDGNGFVNGVVTSSGRFATDGGLKQGASLKDVIKTYGDICSIYSTNGQTLYEYPFNSSGGRTAVVRFAVKNGVVEYISLREVTGKDRDTILSKLRKIPDDMR